MKEIEMKEVEMKEVEMKEEEYCIYPDSYLTPIVVISLLFQRPEGKKQN
jgi:hypothetical protein